MSRSFVTNMMHFLDEKGAIAQSLPKNAKRRAENFGLIVAWVTNPVQLSAKPAVSCWNKINRKPCSGKIDAGIDVGNFDILWHCPVCGEHGSINYWQQSCWDVNYRCPGREL